MAVDKDLGRERAYRFDLFVAPDWGERFDALLDEHVTMPAEGRLLEINCGTGARTIAVAAWLSDGEIVGTDRSPDNIAIAIAKAAAASETRSQFVVADPARLDFESGSFDAVVLDASLSNPSALAAEIAEAVRVAVPRARVAVKLVVRGSFDEFFSVFWEALHDVGIDAEVWTNVERMITERPTLEDARALARDAGMRDAEAHRSKEEWRFETAAALFESPLMDDLFVTDAFAFLPDASRADVRAAVERIVEREWSGTFFSISAKIVVVAGHK